MSFSTLTVRDLILSKLSELKQENKSQSEKFFKKKSTFVLKEIIKAVKPFEYLIGYYAPQNTKNQFTIEILAVNKETQERKTFFFTLEEIHGEST